MIVVLRDPIELQVQLANESSIGNTGPKHCAYAPVPSVVQLSANFSIFFSGVFALWHYRKTASQSVHGVNKMKLQPQQQITSRRFQSGQMSRFVKYLPFPTTSFTWLRAARRVASFFPSSSYSLCYVTIGWCPANSNQRRNGCPCLARAGNGTQESLNRFGHPVPSPRPLLLACVTFPVKVNIIIVVVVVDVSSSWANTPPDC